MNQKSLRISANEEGKYVTRSPCTPRVKLFGKISFLGKAVRTRYLHPLISYTKHVNNSNKKNNDNYITLYNKHNKFLTVLTIQKIYDIFMR